MSSNAGAPQLTNSTTTRSISTTSSIISTTTSIISTTSPIITDSTHSVTSLSVSASSAPPHTVVSILTISTTVTAPANATNSVPVGSAVGGAVGGVIAIVLIICGAVLLYKMRMARMTPAHSVKDPYSNEKGLGSTSATTRSEGEKGLRYEF